MHVVAILALAGLPLANHGPGKFIVLDMVRDEQAPMYFAPREVEAERGDTPRFVVRAGTHNVYFLPDSNPGVKPSRPAVVLLVRHADKAVAATNDPPLSDAGRHRAAALAEALHDAGITRVIVDQSLRTRETAAPFHQSPNVVPIDWANPSPQVRAIADSVRRPGGVSLVIGHRNTIPEIIRALGGPTIPEIPDSAYDDLYMLVLDPGSAAPVFVHASYRTGSTR